MQVDYIVKSKNPYPEWLRDHTVFRQVEKLDKIFPKIGLPNTKEEIEIANLESARTAGTVLWQSLYGKVNALNGPLHSKAVITLSLSGRERNELMNKVQRARNITTLLYEIITRENPVKVQDNKVQLLLPQDLFDGTSPKPLFKKGQSVIGCITALNDLLKEISVQGVNYEAMPEFKAFSLNNSPVQKYTICFSSDGEQGAWDIATASMRGITSCQAWTSPQSRGLVGSISSKYLGIIFIASKNEECKPYGLKMITRCMVRLALHKTTKEPVLILDRCYGQATNEFLNAFETFLKKKTGFKVMSFTTHGAAKLQQDYIVLDENSRAHLKQGEFSYMDSPMPIVKSPSLLAAYYQAQAVSSTANCLTDAQTNITNKLHALMIRRREAYIDYLIKFDAYKAEKAKFDIEPGNANKEFNKPEPTIPIGLSISGGYAAYKNFCHYSNHCDKKGANSGAKMFLEKIWKQFDIKDQKPNTIARAYRMLMCDLSKNNEKIRETVWKEHTASLPEPISYPRASKYFFNLLMDDLKVALTTAWKESI